MTRMLHMHVLFADDLQLWIPMIYLLEVCDILESDLESITQWCHRWRMSINEVICYNYRRKQMVKVTMNGQELAQTHSKNALVSSKMNNCYSMIMFNTFVTQLLLL